MTPEEKARVLIDQMFVFGTSKRLKLFHFVA